MKLQSTFFDILTPEQRETLKRKIQSGEISPDSKEIKDLIKLRYQNDPIGFAMMFCRERFINPETGDLFPSPSFHQDLVDMVDSEDAKGNKFAIAAPRGHAKSTLFTFIYSLHALLFDKAKFILLVSASEDIAKRFLRSLREEFEFNKDIEWLFGPQKTDKWSETEFMISHNRATVIAKGRGAQVRGLQANIGKRPDLIICDDLEDDELVLSETRRHDLESWFTSALIPALDPQVGRLIFVGTVLHMDSLLNRLLDDETYPGFDSRRYRALQPDGTVLWPEYQTKERLEKEKQDYIAAGKLSKFYMEYQNDPTPEEAAKFRPEYFQFFDKLPDPKEITTEIYVDLGGGSANKETADPTAMVVLCLDKDNVFYVNDYVNERFGTNTAKIINKMFELDYRYRPQRFVIENTQATNMIKSALVIEMKKRGKYLNVEYINPTKGNGSDRRGKMSDGKYNRIAALEAPFKFGGIKIRKWMTELQEQLIMFPRGQHDDLIDALAYGYMNMEPQIKIDERYLSQFNDYEPLYPEIGL